MPCCATESHARLSKRSRSKRRPKTHHSRSKRQLIGLSADGKELRSMDNRITWVLRRSVDGAWKIVHEHSSAPVDFDTGKDSLRRMR